MNRENNFLSAPLASAGGADSLSHMEVFMKIKKNVLAEVLRVLGRVVSQTSPEAFLLSIRFVDTGARVWLLGSG